MSTGRPIASVEELAAVEVAQPPCRTCDLRPLPLLHGLQLGVGDPPPGAKLLRDTCVSIFFTTRFSHPCWHSLPTAVAWRFMNLKMGVSTSSDADERAPSLMVSSSASLSPERSCPSDVAIPLLYFGVAPTFFRS